jgi:alkylation response protein AidB-like acyl-CoA dehydrogenase
MTSVTTLSPPGATPPGTTPSGPGDPVENARRLAPLISERAEATERGGTVAPEVVDALHAGEVFRTMAPACLGGREVPSDVAYEVLETISHADGATGWSVMAGMIYIAAAGAFLPERGAKAVLDDPRSVAAGQAAPLGTAFRAEGGWNVRGDFGFASGGLHCNWFYGGFREVEGAHDGPTVTLPSRLPSAVVGVFPVSAVEKRGNWNVLGLVGTGSIDYGIPQQELAEDFSFALFDPELRRGHPRLGLGLAGLTSIGHSAFATGVTTRLLDELAALAASKRRMGRKTLVDDPQFQAFYARARASIRAARCYAIDAIGAWEEAVIAGVVTPAIRAEARLATSHTAEVAVEIAGGAFRFSGSAGLRNGSAIQRCFRDLNAGEQHVFTDFNTFRDAGALLLGAGPDTLLL